MTKAKKEIIEAENNIDWYEGLRISPYAYQKIMYFMYRGDTEVTGFGISDPDDDLLIIDFKLVEQECTTCTIDMKADGLTEYVNQRMDEGIYPGKSFRIWIHTHPGNCPNPSSVDEEQFDEFMSDQPWVIMLIFAKDRSTYCRLGVSGGPGATQELDVEVDWSQACQDIDFTILEQEYLDLVTTRKFVFTQSAKGKNQGNREPSAKEKYNQNFGGIDWADRHSMQQLPDYSSKDGFNDDFYDIDDDLFTKNIHEMTAEEFEEYEEFTDSVGDLEELLKSD